MQSILHPYDQVLKIHKFFKIFINFCYKHGSFINELSCPKILPFILPVKVEFIKVKFETKNAIKIMTSQNRLNITQMRLMNVSQETFIIYRSHQSSHDKDLLFLLVTKLI
jgi:hypothetical protein